jgi:type IV pilus assembly protein PilY1
MNETFRSLILLLLLSAPHPSHGYTAEEFNWFPFFLQHNEKPSVTIVLDNSQSMTQRIHDVPFDPARRFAGYFEPGTYYAYRPMSHGPCFVPDNSTGEWNGNFLNWATTTRLDAARKALTGGPFDLKTDCFIGSGLLESSPAAEYDDSGPVEDVNGRLRFMTPHRQAIAVSSPAGTGRVLVRGRDFTENLALRIRGPRRKGAIQHFGHKARLALFVFNGKNGGKLVQPMADSPEHRQAIMDSIDRAPITTGSPLAETLHTVRGYLRQDNSLDFETGPRYTPASYSPSKAADPFLFPALNRPVPCTGQTVILVTDGRSSHDLGIPADFRNLTDRNDDDEYDLGPEGSTYLMDLAHLGHTRDLRHDEGMEGVQTFSLLAVCASGKDNALLMDAVRSGNFNDRNGNALPDLQDEYDADGDGVPDGYFMAGPDGVLETAMNRAFRLATTDPAEGKPTAANITLSSGKGPGANLMYQSIFFPPTAEGQTAPVWSGQIHAYFLDAKGNLREDTNQDGTLDMTRDRVVEYEGDLIHVHTDRDGDGIVSAEERNATSLDSILDIRFPWSTTPWLNSLSDSEATAQRTDYASPIRRRHIFTFVDANGNMVPDADEIQDFALAARPTTWGDALHFHNYLTLFESRPGDISLDLSDPVQRAIDNLRRNDPPAFKEFLATLAKRQVAFIRGAEVGNATVCGIPDHVRSRTLNGETWRLGDIINSRPVFVGKPAENYHLIYGDKTYEAFVKAYADRRRVVYAGANDGMLHAFNAELNNCRTQTTEFGYEEKPCFPAGMEMWAYVPFNLLPHLKWLMHPEYGKQIHSAYMDLEPRVFDARIFFEPDGATPLDSRTYPHGWGTVLVAGMRMGGARIAVDIDKSDDDAFNPEIDRTMTSAYVIMDITDPERPPVLLAEIALPDQGFTTCRPAVMPMSSPGATASEKNRWYLVFGSGPASAEGAASPPLLGDTHSDRAGRIFLMDLKALVTDQAVRTVQAPGLTPEGPAPFAVLEDASFVSEPVTVDLDIATTNADGAFAADVVYFGTVSGEANSPAGKIWRLVTRDRSPEHWTMSLLMDAGQPISAAPVVALDDTRHPWVYFGTGRLFDRADLLRNETCGFYGIREPGENGSLTWATASASLLFDSSPAAQAQQKAQQDLKIENVEQSPISEATSTSSHEDPLKNEVAIAWGWKVLFEKPGEKALSQAALIDRTVLFSSHTPDQCPCLPGGVTRFWALDYQTGAAAWPQLSETGGGVFGESRESPGAPPQKPVLQKNGPNPVQAFHQSATGNITPFVAPRKTATFTGPVFWKKTTE